MLLEMVAAKTVLTRRNLKLPLDSKIAYPLNQQVKYVEQRESNKRTTSTKAVKTASSSDPRLLNNLKLTGGRTR